MPLLFCQPCNKDIETNVINPIPGSIDVKEYALWLIDAF
jgi:hypothetical protein